MGILEVVWSYHWACNGAVRNSEKKTTYLYCFKFIYWSLAPNVMVFGSGALEVIRPKWCHMGGASWYDWCLTRKEQASSVCAMSGPSEKMGICKPGSGSSPEPNHAGSLNSDFQPPELREINVFCLVPWSMVIYSSLSVWESCPNSAFWQFDSWSQNTIWKEGEWLARTTGSFSLHPGCWGLSHSPWSLWWDCGNSLKLL